MVLHFGSVPILNKSFFYLPYFSVLFKFLFLAYPAVVLKIQNVVSSQRGLQSLGLPWLTGGQGHLLNHASIKVTTSF